MKKPIELFTFICDGCGSDLFKDTVYRASDIEFAEEWMDDSDWITQNDKHYCPACYDYNDDGNYELKNLK